MEGTIVNAELRCRGLPAEVYTRLKFPLFPGGLCMKRWKLKLLRNLVLALILAYVGSWRHSSFGRDGAGGHLWKAPELSQRTVAVKRELGSRRQCLLLSYHQYGGDNTFRSRGCKFNSLPEGFRAALAGGSICWEWIVRHAEYSLPSLCEVMPLLEKSPEYYLDERENKCKQCSVLMATTEQQADLVPELRAVSVSYY